VVQKAGRFVAGLLLLVVLSLAGQWLAVGTAVPLSGPIIGLLAYAAVLLGTRLLDWSLPAARCVAALIGALLVPPLVGVALYGAVAAAGGLRLAAVLVLSTGVTALATAGLFRLCGGST